MSSSNKPQDCRVALLAGGTSRERDVSLASEKGARKALEEAGYSVTTFDPAKKNDLKSIIDGDFDVAFLCLHGKNGEDGTIQGMLELIGVPYVGSDVWASALAMDKAKSKIYYQAAGIKTPTALLLHGLEEKTIEEIISVVGEKSVIKPTKEGSSFGSFMIKSREELAEALSQVFENYSEVLVETYLKGNEYTVAVLGNEKPYALPVIEIVPRNEFYDFESKYAPGGSEHLCPAPLDEEKTAQLKDLAIKAHLALGCSGVSRSDFIMDANGDFWILETNTIPGMTETSLLPDAAKAAGIEFPELCTKLIEYAFDKKA